MDQDVKRKLFKMEFIVLLSAVVFTAGVLLFAVYQNGWNWKYLLVGAICIFAAAILYLNWKMKTKKKSDK